MSCGTIWEHFTCIINRYTKIAFNRYIAYCRCTLMSIDFAESALKVRFRTCTYWDAFDFSFLGHFPMIAFILFCPQRNAKSVYVRFICSTVVVSPFSFLDTASVSRLSCYGRCSWSSVPCLLTEQSSKYDCIVKDLRCALKPYEFYTTLFVHFHQLPSAVDVFLFVKLFDYDWIFRMSNLVSLISPSGRANLSVTLSRPSPHM